MPLRRTRLNPVSDKQRAKKAAAAALVKEEGDAFHDAIKGLPCVVCGRSNSEARKAGTWHQAHHAISQQRLRSIGLAAWLWDERLAIPVCEEPCHRQHTTAHKRIPLASLPPAVFEFIEEHGLSAERVLREYAQ